MGCELPCKANVMTSSAQRGNEPSRQDSPVIVLKASNFLSPIPQVDFASGYTKMANGSLIPELTLYLPASVKSLLLHYKMDPTIKPKTWTPACVIEVSLKGK